MKRDHEWNKKLFSHKLKYSVLKTKLISGRNIATKFKDQHPIKIKECNITKNLKVQEEGKIIIGF